MAEPRVEWGKEIVEKVDSLILEFRAFRDMSQKYFIALDILKWFTGIFVLACVTGLFSWALFVNSSLASTNTTLGQFEKTFAGLATAIAEPRTAGDNQKQEINKELSKQGRDLGKLEGIIDTLVKENKKIAVLVERKGGNLSNLKVFHGMILSVKDNKLDLMSFTDKTAESFIIGDEAAVFINGKDASRGELLGLKSGAAYIYFLPDVRQVVKVEVEKRK